MTRCIAAAYLRACMIVDMKRTEAELGPSCCRTGPAIGSLALSDRNASPSISATRSALRMPLARASRAVRTRTDKYIATNCTMSIPSLAVALAVFTARVPLNDSASDAAMRSTPVTCRASSALECTPLPRRCASTLMAASFMRDMRTTHSFCSDSRRWRADGAILREIRPSNAAASATDAGAARSTRPSMASVCASSAITDEYDATDCAIRSAHWPLLGFLAPALSAFRNGFAASRASLRAAPADRVGKPRSIYDMVSLTTSLSTHK